MIVRFAKDLCKTGTGKAIVISVVVIAAVMVLYFAMLSAMMLRSIYNKPDKPNVVVVLGCQVRGDRPSKMLRRRLDAAVELKQTYGPGSLGHIEVECGGLAHCFLSGFNVVPSM